MCNFGPMGSANCFRLVPSVPHGRVLFICTHNSARSQLAAALWRRDIGGVVASAGTHPADRVHPDASAAARRADLRLAGTTPRALSPVDLDAALVVTVCDRAREELEPKAGWRHWSVPDPTASGSSRTFDDTIRQLSARIEPLRNVNVRDRSEA